MQNIRQLIYQAKLHPQIYGPDTAGPNARVLEAIEILKQECEDARSRLELAHSRIGSTVAQDEVKMQRLRVLKAEERRLNKEIAQQTNASSLIESTHEEVLRVLVKDHINRTIQQYRNALIGLRQELRDTEANLAREREILNESLEIETALQRKLESLQTSSSTYNSKLSETKQEISAVKKRSHRIMTELVKFIDKYYPPRYIEARERRGPLDDMFGVNQKTSSLKSILEDLMNLAVARPGDAYVQIRPDIHWPPYIELLVKAGIATRHPRDASKIKLVEFHI
ncbi:uncharacterized protein VTP21DRAFT_8278 [Calcarisporiella thermophila]|uniref:uncharacterized protein n=1 Tax=Calcarisporiella thermophila TaxID=911321 RepID=UPI0037424C5D